MENSEIIGLPVLVSARCRIVLDQGLCSRYGIPENGAVRARIDHDTIFVYPEGAKIPHTELKRVTIGRFNLPIQWAKQNGAEIGGYVYLLAADSCLQIRAAPWSLQKCRQDRILGVPIKIYEGNQLYIPKTFWIQYGIKQNHGRLVREIRKGRLIFCGWPETHVNSPEIIHTNNRHVPIRLNWMLRNHLSIGDMLWLFGSSDGPAVSIHPICEENFDSD